MVTDRDKAFVGAILVTLAWLLGRQGIEIPAEVKGALETVLFWALPVLAGLIGGWIVYRTPNKKKPDHLYSQQGTRPID